MKYAIIGSKGYIGKHLEFYLRDKGHEVACYDVIPSDEPSYTQVDLTDKASVERISLDVDYIYMFAGLTGTYAGFDRYDSYVDINEKGLINLLDAIRHSQYRPRIVYPSTRLVYKGQEKPLTEDDEKETKTIYAVNKIAAEGLLYAYANSFDIPFTIFRICVPFGNMLSNDYSFGTVGFFIRQARDKGEITLYGDGSIRRTFTSMQDLCYQIYEASLKAESKNQTYNIGGHTYSLKEAAEVIAAHYGANVSTIPFPEKDHKIESGSTFFDDSKIRSLLGDVKYMSLEELDIKI